MRNSRTREELAAAMRMLGSNVTVANAGKKPAMIKWLVDHGMPIERVPTLRDQTRKMSASDTVQLDGTSASDVQRMVAEALAGIKAGSVDMDAVRKMVQAEILTAKPEKIVVDGTKPEVKISGHTHPMFEKVLRLVRAGLNVLLVGPAGCGKTTLAEQIATALNREYGSLHCTAGASESQLTGWLLPIGKGDGAFEYVASEFVRLYESGNSMFLLDEIDAADPNMLLIINSALANGSLHVPQRFKKPHVKRGEGTAIIAAANTFGTGADTMYAGRNQLDAATLDRFYVVEMNYDAAFESSVTGLPAPVTGKWVADEKPSEQDLRDLGAWLNGLRNNVAQHRLRRVVSTRSHMKAIAARKAGVPAYEIKRDLLAGWTRDELLKVGAR